MAQSELRHPPAAKVVVCQALLPPCLRGGSAGLVTGQRFVLGRVVIFIVIPAPPAVIPASPTVIPTPPTVIPTPPAVIPAQAGIYACRLHYRSRGRTTLDSGASRNDDCRGIAMLKPYAGLW